MIGTFPGRVSGEEKRSCAGAPEDKCAATLDGDFSLVPGPQAADSAPFYSGQLRQVSLGHRPKAIALPCLLILPLPHPQDQLPLTCGDTHC